MSKELFEEIKKAVIRISRIEYERKAFETMVYDSAYEQAVLEEKNSSLQMENEILKRSIDTIWNINEDVDIEDKLRQKKINSVILNARRREGGAE